MTAAKVRVTKTEVVLDTVPLGARHWAALAILVILAAGAWWAFYAELPREVSNPGARVWFAHEGDDPIHADAVARSAAAQRAAVIAVGSSVVLENLSPDAALTSASGLRTINLATSGQSVMESLYILHRQGLHAGQLVLVGLTPNEMAQPADIADERLTDGLWLRAPTAFAEEFQREIPKLQEWLTPQARRAQVLSVQRQILYRRIRNGVKNWAAVNLYGDRSLEYQQYRHDDEAPGDLYQQERLRRYLQTGLNARFDANHVENEQILGVLVRYVRSRGADVVILDSPRILGDSLRTYGKYWAPYRAGVRAVADANNVPIVDLHTPLALTPAEFHDPVHLAPAGRTRWSAAVTQYLASRCRVPNASDVAGCR